MRDQSTSPLMEYCEREDLFCETFKESCDHCPVKEAEQHYYDGVEESCDWELEDDSSLFNQLKKI